MLTQRVMRQSRPTARRRVLRPRRSRQADPVHPEAAQVPVVELVAAAVAATIVLQGRLARRRMQATFKRFQCQRLHLLVR